MDAVKYLTELLRMCTILDCDSCPLGIEDRTYCDESHFDECNMNVDNLKKAVAIVEKWSEEHPIKTRKSDFLKMFPNAKMGSNGLPYSSPCNLDATISCQGRTCKQCKEEYWLAAAEGGTEEDQ
jgi:hypothetical protein